MNTSQEKEIEHSWIVKYWKWIAGSILVVFIIYVVVVLKMET